MRALVNCYQGRSRTKRKFHKAPTKQFLLYLKKAAESLVDDEANEHDFDGCSAAEIVQRWLHVICGSDFTQQQVHQMLQPLDYKYQGVAKTRQAERAITNMRSADQLSSSRVWQLRKARPSERWPRGCYPAEAAQALLRRQFRSSFIKLVQHYARQTHGCIVLLTFDTRRLFSLAWEFLCMAP